MEPIKVIRSPDELEGTAYFEFLPGPYRGDHWVNGSVFIQEQNRDSAWFMQGLGALATELDGVFPFVLDLVFPYENVVPGQNWASIRASLKTWLVNNAELLPNGRTTHQISGVPFPIITSKRCSSLRKVFLIRQTPPGDSESQLLMQMRESLNHKYERLGEYRTRDHLALLIAESEDIALVSEQDLYGAFLRATYEQPRPHLDQVWLASTFLDDCSVFCLRGPAVLRAGVNPEQFHFGPEYLAEWLPEVM